MINSSKTTTAKWRRYVSDLLSSLSSSLTTAESDITTLESESLTLLETAATTSGSTITVGSIPSGTQKIEIAFDGVSTDGIANMGVRLGDSGGIETTGYESASSRMTSSGVSTAASNTQIVLNRNGAGDSYSGIMTGIHVGSNRWVFSGTFADADGSTVFCISAGDKTLSAELTQVQVRSGDTFDLGAFTVFTVG